MAAIDEVLTRLAKYGVMRCGEGGNQWTAYCPAHNDKKKQSLTISVGRNGRVLFHCFVGCGYAAIAKELGMEPKELHDEPEGVLTKAQLAEAKGIPLPWLEKECGLFDRGEGKGVGIPYYGEMKKPPFLTLRTRTTIYEKDHTRHGYRKKLHLYGHWRLAEAKKKGEIVVVEGESDCWTLWYKGFHALGVPGAGNWKIIRKKDLQGFKRIYVWNERDKGGGEFVPGVASKAKDYGIECFIIQSEDAKDPSSLYLRDPGGFSKAFKEILAEARPAGDMVAPVFGKLTISGEASKPPAVTAGMMPGLFGNSDTGNAKRLVLRHGQDIRYVRGWKSWMAWDGNVWKTEADSEVMQRAKETVQAIYAEAMALPAENVKARQELARHAANSESARALHAMIDLARSERYKENPLAEGGGVSIEIEHEMLNPGAWLLACPNGTLDLRTGRLKSPCRDDLMTKRCRTAFDPQAQCPQWEAFLKAIFAGEYCDDLVGYIQRLLGYCLTGDVSTHLLAVFWGGGGNGKGTLLNTFLHTVGKAYAGAAPAALLMTSRQEKHPTEIADLFGKRLVVCQETDDGCRLNEALVKWLTGGDELKARKMREDFWEFSPTHKLILSTNYRPKIRGTDRGIWRRLRLIPFTVTFDGDKEDRDLKTKLRAEAPGILAWAVRGCLEWQKGERVPSHVLAATREYHDSEDLVKRFVEEECVDGRTDPRANNRSTASSVLYAAFCQWLERTGEVTRVTQMKFSLRLGELGFATRKSNVIVYDNIVLSADVPARRGQNGATSGVKRGHQFDLADLDD